MIITDVIDNKSSFRNDKIDSILLKFSIHKLLYSGKKSIEVIHNALMDQCYDEEYINVNALKHYLNTTFEIENDEIYMLSDYQKNIFRKLCETKNLINQYKNYSETNLVKIIEEYGNNFDAALISSIILSQRNNTTSENLYEALYFDYICNENLYRELFCDFIKKVSPTSDILNLEDDYFSSLMIYPRTNYQKDIFKLFKIYSFNDILSIPFEKMILLIIDEPYEYLEIINNFNAKRINRSREKINEKINSLSQTAKEVFNYRIRNSYDDKILTLQELGDMLGISRERVRQIEAKFYNSVLEGRIDYDFINTTFSYLDSSRSNFIHAEVFNYFLNDEPTCKYYKVYLEKREHTRIRYNSSYDVLYDSTCINIEDIIESTLDDLPCIITKDKYNNYGNLEKACIDLNYRLTKKEVYLKNSLSESDTYLALLDDLFPNGYRIASDEDFDLLMKKYTELYETDTPTTKRYIATKLDRSKDYCLCDRGTYIKYDRCPKISPKLFKEIMSYIKNSKYTVYYSEIFNKFRLDLAMDKVTNQFLLKGLIDHNLNHKYQTNRDSIKYGNQLSKWDAVVNFMRAQKGVFSLADINAEFPDIQYTVMQGIIAYESSNDLIILYDKKYIYAENTNIELLKYELKPIIEDMFNSLNTDFITSHKLYSKIILSNNNIFKKLSFPVDSFNTYSIVKYLYPNEYFYRKPIISKLDSGAMTTIKAIHDYLIQFDKFDNDVASKFITKMNLSFKWIYEYQELCNYMSDEFVQIDKKVMVKKDAIDIDDYIIEKIDKTLEDLISKYGEINITDFSAYFIFPKIEDYRWNEYMVIGIINSYLNDKYEFYTKDSNYYIRRLNYEL